MLMNLDDIINSFKKRVDDLARYWDAVSPSPEHMVADEEEIKQLKKKLDMVQEQNAAIMIDLEHIKKILVLDEYAPNNLFTLLNTSADQLQVPSTPLIERHRPPNTPQSETSQSQRRHSISKRFSHQFHHQLSAPPLRQPTHYNALSEMPFTSSLEHPPLRKHETEPSFLIPGQLETQGSAEQISSDEGMVAGYDFESNEREVSPRDTGQNFLAESGPSSLLSQEGLRDIPVVDSQEIENYDLQIIDNPRSVAEVYHEYETSLKSQIEDFERLFGKGQLSKLPKIRTYQRRRALVTEIDKYATTYDKSTQEAIEFFEQVRKVKRRTVPGLYNNLGKILRELGEPNLDH